MFNSLTLLLLLAPSCKTFYKMPGIKSAGFPIFPTHPFKGAHSLHYMQQIACYAKYMLISLALIRITFAFYASTLLHYVTLIRALSTHHSLTLARNKGVYPFACAHYTRYRGRAPYYPPRYSLFIKSARRRSRFRNIKTHAFHIAKKNDTCKLLQNIINTASGMDLL